MPKNVVPHVILCLPFVLDKSVADILADNVHLTVQATNTRFCVFACMASMTHHGPLSIHHGL
jgi:hypothetical protein